MSRVGVDLDNRGFAGLDEKRPRRQHRLTGEEDRVVGPGDLPAGFSFDALDFFTRRFEPEPYPSVQPHGIEILSRLQRRKYDTRKSLYLI